MERIGFVTDKYIPTREEVVVDGNTVSITDTNIVLTFEWNYNDEIEQHVYIYKQGEDTYKVYSEVLSPEIYTAIVETDDDNLYQEVTADNPHVAVAKLLLEN